MALLDQWFYKDRIPVDISGAPPIAGMVFIIELPYNIISIQLNLKRKKCLIYFMSISLHSNTKTKTKWNIVSKSRKEEVLFTSLRIGHTKYIHVYIFWSVSTNTLINIYQGSVNIIKRNAKKTYLRAQIIFDKQIHRNANSNPKSYNI